MAEARVLGSRERIDFSKIKTSVPIPNLIEVQKHSYERFLQMYVAPSDREDVGLQAVFKSLFPIHDFRETSSLEFVEYSIGNWECKCGNLEGIERLRITCGSCGKRTIAANAKAISVACSECGTASRNTVEICDHCGDPVALKFKYDVPECQERGMNFTVPLKVTIRLVVWDKDPETGSRSIRDIKQQEVYFGEIPMLTENGTFIINGTERVIVSQLHRSPGVFFQAEENKTLFTAKLIPYRGSWVEFEYDTKNILYVRIDRKRKFLGTIFLRALGYKLDEEIMRLFYQAQKIRMEGKKFFWKTSPGLVNHKIKADIVDPKTDDVIVRKGKRVSLQAYQKMVKLKIHEALVDEEELKGIYALGEIVDRQTGEVLVDINGEITPELLERMGESGVETFEFCVPEYDDMGNIIVGRSCCTAMRCRAAGTSWWVRSCRRTWI